MAKHTVNPERSKVRIFFVEADLAAGDMQELTQALTSAIRPTPLMRSAAVQQITSGPSAAPSELVTDAAYAEFNEQDDDQGNVRSAAKNSKPRTYKKPQPVDIDMKAGGKPFVDFAVEKAPTTHRARYLVAATWLHEFAKQPTVTVDHIFTCYKAAGWTFDVTDPTQIFRLLKGEGVGSWKRGEFAINHLGLAETEKMKAAA